MDPEQEKDLVVRDLEQRLAQVHKAFEAVLADIVTTYFENRPVNKQTVPDIVRDKIRYLFEYNEQFKVQDGLEDLPRNGISLMCRGDFYKRYKIKILYSPDGKLPVKGMTSRKKRILCQKNQLTLWPFRSIHSLKENDHETLILVILWNARFINNIAYQDLLLVRTIEGENNQPVIYWTDPIKDPTSMKEEVTPDAYTDEMDDNFGISFDVS